MRGGYAGASVNVDSRTTLASQSGQWFGRASTVVRSGVVVLAYYESSHHGTNDGELHIRFSTDYGASWSAEDTFTNGGAVTGFPMNPPDKGAAEDAGEPKLYLCPNGDLLIHMWRVDYGVTANGTYQSRSTDGGATWSTPAVIDFSGIADDAKVFATDDHFVYNSVIYAGVRIYQDAAGTSIKSAIVKSEDNGTTWTHIADISDFTTDTEEFGMEYIGDNTIVAIFRDLPHTTTYKSTSTDLGATWSALSSITSQVGISGRHRIYTRAHLKGESSWWNDNVLIMTGFQFQISGNGFTRRNAVWISTNKGTSWSNAICIDETIEDAGYGDIFYNPTTDRYIVVSYQGTQAESVLKQYNLNLHGI